MLDSEPLSYATPQNPVGGGDHYFLRVLSNCYWVFAGFMVIGGIVCGLIDDERGSFLLAAIMIAFGLLMAMDGYCLRAKRCFGFVMCTGALIMLSIPFGTILGISTVVVLRRPGVVRLFVENQAPLA